MMDKPIVLSIAGFDPCGGAGILADNKAIEANGGYAMSVLSAITCQNDVSFEKATWLDGDGITEQLAVLLKRFSIRYYKFGLIENLEVLHRLILYIRQEVPGAVILWDPILKASTGWVFHQQVEKDRLEAILNSINCITPNLPEANQLFGEQLVQDRLRQISTHCAVYLKGGHGGHPLVTDHFYTAGQLVALRHQRLPKGDKHGSGCVLSASLLTRLALGDSWVTAASRACLYTRSFLASNETLLGYHTYTKQDETTDQQIALCYHHGTPGGAGL